ncbi:MAG: hypothetical protein K2F81_01425, partial [Ruminococcus sp.]|nr:hypothetical protein [Ruminococcus sp.]
MTKKDTSIALKKGAATFSIIGKAKINDYTFDLEHEYDSGWTSNIMNIGIDCGKGNTVYAEMSGGYFPPKCKKDNVIYVHGVTEDENENKKEDFDNSFTVDWEDRFDETILETIGNSCFITVGIEKDDKEKTFYKKFLTEYDAVQYISEHLESDTVVTVSGRIVYESDGENTYIKKRINNIALSKAEDNDFKATFKQTILIDNDTIGKTDKEKNTIPMSVYVVDYVGKPKINGKKITVRKNFAFPVNMEFAIGENTDLTTKQLSKFFKAKKNEIIELTVVGNIVEGATIVNITDDDIPDDIKELIELGLYSEDEAKAKCAIGNNNREKRMIITKP